MLVIEPLRGATSNTVHELGFAFHFPGTQLPIDGLERADLPAAHAVFPSVAGHEVWRHLGGDRRALAADH